MSEFFTGGLYLNQTNIITYNNRPFTDTDEMNNQLVESINKKVGEDDKLYILGNFLFGSLDEEKFYKTARYFRNKIICRNLFLLYGNHDRRMKKNQGYTSLFRHCSDYMEIKAEDDTSLILFHYPMFIWNRQRSGAIHLHGEHFNTKIKNSLSVAVDNYKSTFKVENPKEAYRPFSLREIHQLIK